MTQPIEMGHDTDRSSMPLVLEFSRADKGGDPHGLRLGTQVYHVRSPGGAITVAQLDFNQALLDDLELLRTSPDDDGLAQRLGNQLRQFLQSTDWGQMEAAIAEAVHAEQPIELVVQSAAAELYLLPWELLTIRASGQHIAELPEVLVRYAWPEAKAKGSPTPPTRVLLAWSAAGGSVSPAAHVEVLADACGSSQLHSVARVSQDELRAVLQKARTDERPFTALHLLCHGTETASGHALVWNQGDGQRSEVTSAQLRRLLARHAKELRVVTLCACDSGNDGGPTRHLGSLVQTLHRVGIPWVIGSRYPFSQRGALAFTEVFYGQLMRKGASVASAFRAARDHLSTLDGVGRRDWMSARLYSALAEPEAPRGPSEKRRDDELGELYQRKERLERMGAPTDEVLQEILQAKRMRRPGGRLRPGNVLGPGGRYTLARKLGRGGFATVWEAEDRESGRRVALKVLHSELAGNPLRRDRFFRGARTMADLQHQAVVPILQPHGDDDGFFYYVMELMPGGNLEKAVQEGRIEREQAIPLVLQVGEALATAHARACVHRDVKPANILLDAAGAPRLTDFDLVAAADTTGGTRTGAMGTFIYAAPEQMDRPQEADARADVYGLAMTAVFLLHGGKLPMSVVRDLTGFVRRLGCEKRLEAVLLQALEWDVEQRHADASAFCAAVRAALEPPADMVAHVALADVAPPHLQAIPGGSFLMGRPETRADLYDREGPVREVVLSPFTLGIHPVTQGQWQALMGNNPSDPDFGIGPELPVTMVSWLDVIEFLNQLSEREGLSPCYRRSGDEVEWDRRMDGYRLPTEAEWEYSCRAGTQTRYSFGNDDALLGEHGWYRENSSGKLHPVGEKRPNDWGLHDMHGHVWEWCWDWHGLYPTSKQTDPQGPEKDNDRVLRGGSFMGVPRNMRSAIRRRGLPGFRSRYSGFRVARGRPAQHAGS